MEIVLIRLITQAHRAGTEFDVRGDELLVRGTPPPAELVEHRLAVRQLLTGEVCVACGAPHWIREHGTALPWCRPCAGRRGVQLLRAEQSHLVTDTVTTDHREVA